MIAVAPRAGAQVRDIRAAARLGDRQCGDLLAGQHLWQHACLHLGPCGPRDRGRADSVAHQTGADAARAGTRKLLARDDLHELVGGDAAIFLRESKSQQADSSRLAIELAREFAGFVPVMGERRDLLLDEAPHHVAERVMLGGIERALHRETCLDRIRLGHHGSNLGRSLARSG
ncbi:hypothetical protein ABIA45_006025 [Bradyrhizobium sp. USDA 336]